MDSVGQTILFTQRYGSHRTRGEGRRHTVLEQPEVFLNE